MAFKAKKPLAKKRKTKTERKKLVEKLDSIVSLIVRARDKRCVICGSRENLTNGHLWSRVAYSTRWSLLNCNCQCWGCNMRHEYDPYSYQEWFRKKFGEKVYHELYREFHNSQKLSDIQLKHMLAEFQDLYETLQKMPEK